MELAHTELCSVQGVLEFSHAGWHFKDIRGGILQYLSSARWTLDNISGSKDDILTIEIAGKQLRKLKGLPPKTLHCLKNVTTLSYYNFDVHESILMIFDRNVTDKVSNKKKLHFLTST